MQLFQVKAPSAAVLSRVLRFFQGSAITLEPYTPPDERAIPADLAEAIRDVLDGLHDAGFPTVVHLRDVAERHGVAPPRGLSDFASRCPPGFDTVIHWMMRQGRQPEDLGGSEGARLWRLTEPGGRRADVVTFKVRAPRALAEVGVCEWVRAYPEEVLSEQLGGAD